MAHRFAAIVFLFTVISCDGHEKTVTSVLGSLDLSPNDNCIVFSYSQDDNYSLYVGKIGG